MLDYREHRNQPIEGGGLFHRGVRPESGDWNIEEACTLARHGSSIRLEG